MSIESIIENRSWTADTPTSGTITTVADSPNVVGVGTVFTTDLTVGDLFVWEDAAGNRKMSSVKTITDNLNIVLDSNAVGAVAGASWWFIPVANQFTHYFLVDNSLDSMPIVDSGGQAQSALYASDPSLSQIDIDEGITIKSVYIRLPFQFTLAGENYILRFRHMDSAGNDLGAIDTIGENGLFKIPVENIEVPVNAYAAPPPGIAAGGTYQISIQFLNASGTLAAALTVSGNDFLTPRVSMVDSPDVMNGSCLPIFVGARIIHAAQALT